MTEHPAAEHPATTITERLRERGHTVTGEVCEKCWADAYMRAMSDTSKDQSGHYADITVEVENDV